jgi:hypothetical protein
LYDINNYRWLNAATMPSSRPRHLIYKTTLTTVTKACQFDPGEALAVYNKLSKISSIALRTKTLRLIHGDVYCGARLVRFGLSEIETCIRCFEVETINHLLYQCPYSQMVWNSLGVPATNFASILHGDLTEAEFEFRCTIIDRLVFRKGQIPPNILIENIVNSYVKGLSWKKKVRDFAVNAKSLHERYGTWL